MASNFDRWEKDPFFSAAEEVQESADRMESTYRTWLHSLKTTSTEWNREDLRRDLSTALDTAKWQLEEFERAVQSSYCNSDADEAKHRHRQFVLALEGKISLIQNSLQESAASNGKPSSPSVQLNKGERDELALFLSGPQSSDDRIEGQTRGINQNAVNSDAIDGPSESNCMNCHCHPSVEANDGKPFGIRRTASACADMASWNITIREDELASHSSGVQVEMQPRRVPSFSAFGIVESLPILKLPKNGFRKWKPDEDVAFLRSQPQNRGANSSYERNKSCLDNCDDCYDKQLRGWYGTLHRLMQRVLYQVQYVRSMQITFWATLVLFMMGKSIGLLLFQFEMVPYAEHNSKQKASKEDLLMKEATQFFCSFDSKNVRNRITEITNMLS